MAARRSGNETMEGEQERSLWASTVEHKLLILKEGLQNELDEFQILKLPEHYRQPTAEFTPAAWGFGLHNRENLDSTGSEAVKLAVVVLFGLDEQSKWIDFCDAVVPDPKSMLTCYGLHVGVTDLIEDEIKQVLAFDALCLAAIIEANCVAGENRRLWLTEYITSIESGENFLSTFGRFSRIVSNDMCKIENQIPFVLIKRAIKHIRRLRDPQYEDEDHPVSDANGGQVHGPSPDQRTHVAAKEGIIERAIKYFKKLAKPQHEDEGHPVSDANAGHVPDPYLEIWMKAAVEHGMMDFIDISDNFYNDANAHSRLSKSHHVLDAALKTICGVNGMQRISDFSQNDYIHIPSATKLRDSGIKIVGAVGPLCTMSYNKDKKCLSLPKMHMFDGTVPLVRNIARYEQFLNNKCMFHDYVILMLDLIETSEDFTFLVKRGVIHNLCGNRGFKLWKALDQELGAQNASEEHNEMKRDINRRCKLIRYRLWSEFRTLFFSRPWLTLSAIAVVLVTVATVVQTYATVIGSNGMQPQFKP